MTPSSRRILVAAGIGVLAGGIAIAALTHLAREISYRALVESLCALPPRTLAIALCATALSYIVITANDFSALRYAGAKPPVSAVLMAAFCGCAMGNVIGFGALSGGAIRYRIYTCAGVSRGRVARATVFIAAAFAVGVAETVALGVALRAGAIGDLLGIPAATLRGLAGLVLGVSVAVLVSRATGGDVVRLGPLRIALPSSGLTLAQLGITLADVATASVALWVLLPATGLDFPTFVVIYAAALCLGIVSHAPGGLGVFDAALLYTVGTMTSPSAVAAALVAYRAIYFALPFILAAMLLMGTEIRRSLRRA